MSRISNEKREIFNRLHSKDMKPIDIANILGVSRRTIMNWINILKTNNVSCLYRIYKPLGKPSRFDLEKMKKEFEDNKFSFNYEIADILNCSTSLVCYFRNKLGYTHKKARTVYKEADEELKKNLQPR